MTPSSDRVPRLSYWTLRCFVLKTLPTAAGSRTRFATLIGKVARRYGTRAFLASPRNARNLTDVLNVLLQSKRFRLIDVSNTASGFARACPETNKQSANVSKPWFPGALYEGTNPRERPFELDTVAYLPSARDSGAGLIILIPARHFQKQFSQNSRSVYVHWR